MNLTTQAPPSNSGKIAYRMVLYGIVAVFAGVFIWIIAMQMDGGEDNLGTAFGNGFSEVGLILTLLGVHAMAVREK